MSRRARLCFFCGGGLVGVVFLTLWQDLVLAAEFYKWRDARGQIHYTQTPPPKGQEAEQIKLRPTGRSKERSAGTGDHAESAESDQTTDNAGNKGLTEYCQNLQRNLRTANANQNLSLLQSDGTRKFLSAEERQKQISDTEATLSRFCQNVPASADR